MKENLPNTRTLKNTNSNFSRVKDYIANATGRNSGDEECIQNSYPESSNSDEEDGKVTTKQENTEVEQKETSDSESSNTDGEDTMVITVK